MLIAKVLFYQNVNVAVLNTRICRENFKLVVKILLKFFGKFREIYELKGLNIKLSSITETLERGKISLRFN